MSRRAARRFCARWGHRWLFGRLADNNGRAVLYDVCERCHAERVIEPKAAS